MSVSYEMPTNADKILIISIFFVNLIFGQIK